MTHRKSLYFICGDVKKMEQGTREQGDGSVPAMVGKVSAMQTWGAEFRTPSPTEKA